MVDGRIFFGEEFWLGGIGWVGGSGLPLYAAAIKVPGGLARVAYLKRTFSVNA